MIFLCIRNFPLWSFLTDGNLISFLYTSELLRHRRRFNHAWKHSDRNNSSFAGTGTAVSDCKTVCLLTKSFVRAFETFDENFAEIYDYTFRVIDLLTRQGFIQALTVFYSSFCHQSDKASVKIKFGNFYLAVSSRCKLRMGLRA